MCVFLFFRHVATFVKKSERSANNDDKFTNLYMKHLDDDITEELVRLKFSQFGPIVSVKIMRRPDGSSLGFGFVSFQNPESAIKAQEAMHGMPIGMFTDLMLNNISIYTRKNFQWFYLFLTHFL
jgi:RNA recognition motif-containing protein